MGTTPKRRRSADSPARRGLADALFSSTQQRVLAILFGQPDRSFYSAELIRMVAAGSGAVQRELARLEHSGLVTARRVGRQKHYQANRQSPLFDELSGIVRKTVGLADPLRAALEPLAPRIRAAFVFGSVAKNQDTVSSDIDLMVVGDLSYAEIYAALEPWRKTLAREVSLTLYAPDDVAARKRTGNAFLMRVLEQPKLWIIGSDRDLAA